MKDIKRRKKGNNERTKDKDKPKTMNVLKWTINKK